MKGIDGGWGIGVVILAVVMATSAQQGYLYLRALAGQKQRVEDSVITEIGDPEIAVPFWHAAALPVYPEAGWRSFWLSTTVTGGRECGPSTGGSHPGPYS